MDDRKKNFKRLLIPLLLSLLIAFTIVIPAAVMPPLDSFESNFGNTVDAQAAVPELMPPRPGLFNFRPYGESGSLAPTPGFSTLFRENTVPAQRASVPTTGEARILVVLVQFSDVNFTAPRNDSTYWNWLFDQNLSSNSLYNYYREVSYGKLTLNGGLNIPPIVTVSKTMADYGADSPFEIDAANGPIYRLAQDALIALSNQPEGFDFSPYDFNPKDGVIDHLLIVHAGSGQESVPDPNNQLIWSHRWAILTPDGKGQPLNSKDGKTYYAKGYTMQPEDGTLGVFAHEFGHDLGLPDLYDRDNDSFGLGDWSLMASGSWNGSPAGTTPAHMSAWEKMQLGWLTPQNITKQQIDIPTVSSNPVAYRLPLESSYEYFLIENRWSVGFDTALPGFGLLIYHVDESMPDNDNQQHYKVALEQADNLHHLEQIPYLGNDGDPGDPYPGSTSNRSFTGTSSPNNRSYQGKPSTVALNYIGDSGTSMTINAILTITATGGTVEDISGAKVEFPANAVLRDSVVRITVVDPANIPPSTDSRIKALSYQYQKVWEFEPSGTRFSKPVKITLPYDLTGSSGITEDNLRIFYYDPKEIAWLPVGGKVDKATKTVTAEVNHFSMYTVMESSLPVSTSGNLISYLALTNNPFSPNGDGKKDNTIFKFNLARDARVNIRIYDSQGNLVVTLVEGINQMAGAGTIVWDGTNQAGQTVGSGIYVFKIEAADEQGQSQTMTKPVAVVRPR